MKQYRNIVIVLITALLFACLYFAERTNRSESKTDFKALNDRDAVPLKHQERSRRIYDFSDAYIESGVHEEVSQDVFSSSFSPYESEMEHSTKPYRTITLERSGQNVSYLKLSILSTGQANRLKIESGDGGNIERSVGSLNKKDFAKLCFVLDRLGFDKLEKEYLATWTHDATYIVTVQTDAGSKEVYEYGRAGPIELWAIEEILLSIQSRLSWKKQEGKK